ncbi:MAG: LON peptidase substrate-binding domain-containing protein [Deltaproteobacteria bacterium]|nr:LON peptidase substrate-binding domain-containing protein [Deltaproteobacteria bacterium]
MATPDEDKVTAALSRFAIFPLPGAVLLPRSQIALHIFEPRYRKMIKDCIDGSGVLGLAHLYPATSQAGEEPPKVHPVLGVGLVDQVEALPDGRFNIVLNGVLRARILEELPATEPYRLVHAQVLSGEPGEEQQALVREAAEGLRRMVLTLCSQSPGPALMRLVSQVKSAKEPAALVDLIAGTLVESPRERQVLLEQLSVHRRIDKVSARVASLLARAAPRPSDKTLLN